jgi:N-acetylneuraminic acid mutarotase
MRRSLRQSTTKYLSVVAGMATVAGMFLTGATPAQAATTAPAHAATAAHTTAAHTKASHSKASAHNSVRPLSPAAEARRLVQAQATPDSKAVCAAVKVGYSTCMALLRKGIKPVKGIHPDTTPVGYGPSDLQSAYNLPSSGAGNGQTVAVVDAYDDPTAEADLQVYRQQYGLPVCDTANGCFQKLNQDGQASPLPPAAGDNGWDVEESLDVDMVSAVCPNCHIDLIEANSNSDSDLYTAEDAAVATGAKFVSNSWAGSEYSGETTDDSYFNHPGVAITAASADFGYGTYYPSASQYVTSVGGTTLNQDSSTPRGWTESAWSGTGSGCSTYEPKPTWQTDTGCSNRTETDVSADADPNTGVALYDSYSAGGWTEVGGTSVATPIIASTYALGGTPASGTYPSSYPYSHTSDLNDVTTGSNGDCTPAYLCTAGPGYDGPTGLGTPDGVQAFSSGPYGTISGEVSSKSGPLTGATVTVGSGYTATTDSSGDYTINVPDGTYNVSAEAFGYRTKTVSSVDVTQGSSTTENFTLTSVPSYTLSGTVTDGSGHRWPLYASIAVSGYPGGAVYTNPYTGQYSVTLPEQATYNLTVTPVYPGYNTGTTSVHIGKANATKNIRVTVDSSTCTAPGYGYKYTGDYQNFTGWSGSTGEDGWNVVDNEGNGETWNFSNPGELPPPPGGDNDFASIDPEIYNFGDFQDTSLVSPVVNLSKVSDPTIGFDSDYEAWPLDQTADVDLSLDGGQTWTNVWEQTVNDQSGAVSIAIPQAANQSDVQVRFHFTQTYGFGFPWEVDNVFIGLQSCVAQPGGLVDGVVTDNNTGDPVNGASVTSNSNPSQSGVSAATPNDPNLSDGFYWLFASTGATQFTAADGAYTPSTQTVQVAANAVAHQDWSLQAGHLEVTPGSISDTVTLGGAKTNLVKFSNDGTQPVQVKLAEQNGTFTPMTQGTGMGAPIEKIKGHFTPTAMVLQGKKDGKAAHAKLRAASSGPSDTPWTSIANFPTPIMDNAVGYDTSTGNVYSVAGYDGSENTANGYVYSGSSQSWTALPPAPAALEAPGGAFLNGSMYIVGGWDVNGNPTNTLYAYNASTQAWTTEANLPEAISAPAVATLNGQLYVVGGCTTGNCSPTSQAVYAYNPSTNSWTQEANYPVVAAFAACAGVDGELACAGGDDADTGASYTSTYVYNPGTNSWSQGANMPFDDWAMGYAGSNNQLQIFNGVTANSSTVTNQAAEYDPSTNSWSTLPNSNNAEYRGGGTCGIYQVGGSTGGFAPQSFAQSLPGYNSCGAEDVPWLSESTDSFTLTPGQSTTVAVTVDSSVLSQPGTYTADLTINSNSPYQYQPVGITLQANPPSTWGKVTGTVTDASTGNPIAGATVEICTQYNKQTGTCGSVSYTLKTDTNGDYQLWLNQGYNPLQIIAAIDGYAPVSKVVKFIKGLTTTVNFALNKTS